MTSGDLNVDLLKVFYLKVVDLCQTYPTPFVVCRYNACFFLDMTVVRKGPRTETNL